MISNSFLIDIILISNLNFHRHHYFLHKCIKTRRGTEMSRRGSACVYVDLLWITFSMFLFSSIFPFLALTRRQSVIKMRGEGEYSLLLFNFFFSLFAIFDGITLVALFMFRWRALCFPSFLFFFCYPSCSFLCASKSSPSLSSLFLSFHFQSKSNERKVKNSKRKKRTVDNDEKRKKEKWKNPIIFSRSFSIHVF